MTDRTLSRAIWAALVATLPLATMAEPWQCDFTVECALATGCDSASFSAQVIAADHADELFLTTALGESRVFRLTAEATLPASYAGAGQIGTAELLTIEADLTAILSVHLFDDAAVSLTYFGTCAELT